MTTKNREMNTILEIESLSKSFNKGKSKVLNAINLTVKKGEIIAIVGESGSGKTTLTRLISGLDVQDNGVITLNDKIVASDTLFTVPEKRNIGMVFQDYALFPHLTVFENIRYGLSKNENPLNRVEQVLQLVGLQGFEKRFPHQLSGGQQQRIALARALAPKPELLILDEPFSNLDVVLKMQVRNDIYDILKQTESTAIFVTHDTEDAIAIADQIVVLKDGAVVQKGTAIELFQNPINLYVASLFSTVLDLKTSDLSCFGFKTVKPNKTYAIRLNEFKVDQTSDFSVHLKIDKSKFYQGTYFNTTKLPNNKRLHFYSSKDLTEKQIHLGFDSPVVLEFDSADNLERF